MEEKKYIINSAWSEEKSQNHNPTKQRKTTSCLRLNLYKLRNNKLPES